MRKEEAKAGANTVGGKSFLAQYTYNLTKK